MYKINYQKGGVYDFRVNVLEDGYITTYGGFIRHYPFQIEEKSLLDLVKVNFNDLHLNGDTFSPFKAFFINFIYYS